MLIGLFERSGAPAFPLVLPRLFVVTRWCSGEGGFSSHHRILAPDQVTPVVDGKDSAFQLPPPEATATNVEVFSNRPCPPEGTPWGRSC
jgi:hypothetical protein